MWRATCARGKIKNTPPQRVAKFCDIQTVLGGLRSDAVATRLPTRGRPQALLADRSCHHKDDVLCCLVALVLSLLGVLLLEKCSQLRVHGDRLEVVTEQPRNLVVPMKAALAHVAEELTRVIRILFPDRHERWRGLRVNTTQEQSTFCLRSNVQYLQQSEEMPVFQNVSH